MSPFIAREGAFWLDCVLLGIAMALVYDSLRVFRRVVPHAGFWISLEDLLYWAFVSFRFFGLLYSENNGSLRWFSVAGAFLGMALFEKTAGPLFVRAVSAVFLRMMELAAKGSRRILAPFVRAGHAAKKNAASGKRRLGKRLERGIRLSKKRLTVWGRMAKMNVCGRRKKRQRGE